MKKIILAAALLISMSSSFAINYTTVNTVVTHMNTKKPRIYIPQACIASYNAMYPGATTIKWVVKSETTYQVTFMYGGVKMTASYAQDGTYLGK